MTGREQIRAMIKAQDLVRQVYCQHDDSLVDLRLKQLDKDMTSLINLLGRMFENALKVA